MPYDSSMAEDTDPLDVANLDKLLDYDLMLYLGKGRLCPDSQDAGRWVTTAKNVFSMIEARAGRGGNTGEIGALAEQLLVPDDPDAQVGAMVERYGREEVLRVIGEDVNREAAGDERVG